MIKKKKRTPQEIRKAIGKQLRFLRRNMGHIEKLWTGSTPWPLTHQQLRTFWIVQQVYAQQLHMYTQRTHSVQDRIVSIHQPHVRPIGRGKAAANTEFGAKLNVALCDGIAWPDHIGWDAHNESECLMHHVECYKQRYGYYPEAVNVDGIYGTRLNRGKLKHPVSASSAKRSEGPVRKVSPRRPSVPSTKRWPNATPSKASSARGRTLTGWTTYRPS